VDDDRAVRDSLRRSLEFNDFEVVTASDGAEALAVIGNVEPDVVVMDVMMPRLDGLETTKALRAAGNNVPILVLTARDAVADRVDGLDAGGDDYLTKPFALAELLVRVGALLRRRLPEDPPADPPAFVLDPGRHSLRHGDREASLTPTEFRILAALAAAPGDVVRHATLIAAAWPDGAVVHDNTLHVYLGRIRRKLGEVGSAAEIDTVRSVGYRLR
jgi:two-component system response regulator MprA